MSFLLFLWFSDFSSVTWGFTSLFLLMILFWKKGLDEERLSGFSFSSQNNGRRTKNRSQKVAGCGTFALIISCPCLISFDHTRPCWLLHSFGKMKAQDEHWPHNSVMPGPWEKSRGLSVLGTVGSKRIKETCLPLWCEWKHEAQRANSLERKSNKQPGLVVSWKSKWIGKCHNKPQIATEITGHSFYPACLDISCSFWNSLKKTPYLEFLKPRGENWEATVSCP